MVCRDHVSNRKSLPAFLPSAGLALGSSTPSLRHTHTSLSGFRPALHSKPSTPAFRRVLAAQMSDSPPPSQITETTLEPDDEGETVIVKPDQRLAAAVTFLGGAATYAGDGWLLAGLPLLLLGLLLYVQTVRVRFVFGPRKMSVGTRGKEGDMKFIRGWEYAQFAAWAIYPTPAFPVLAYFRETESYGQRGSIHFFPVLFDGAQLVELMKEKTGMEPS